MIVPEGQHIVKTQQSIRGAVRLGDAFRNKDTKNFEHT